jgi:hypothetical protein
LQVTVVPGEFETFFERIVQRNLTLFDMPEIAEAASADLVPAQRGESAPR